MKVEIIQTSFAAGEIGPSLYGRTDIVQYANACQLVENMLPRSYGPAISMPGTRYVATVSDSTLNTRLIKFVFNRTDSYAIEMGDLYMRFYTDRGQVVTASGTETLTSLAANLVAHYRLDDNAGTTVVLDDDGGTHNGTSSTLTSSLSTTAIVGNGFDFGGVNYVEIPDNAAFSFSDTTGTNPFSLAGWIYYSPNGDDQYLITKNAVLGASGGEWSLAINAVDKLVFVTNSRTTSTASFIKTNQVIAPGWHFIVATYDGRGGSTAADGKNLYVDGALVTDVTRTTQAGYEYMIDSPATVMISGFTQTSGVKTGFLNDKADNVAIFNKVLSITEVASLYTSATYQITTVFRESEVFDVHYTQLNDIIWLTHPSHPPQKLIRTSDNSWAISNAPIIGGPFLDDNTPTPTAGSVSAGTVTITASATTGTVNLTVSPTNASLFTLSGSTLGHHNAYWMLGGLAHTNVTTGLQEVGYVRITHVINSYTATATVLKNIKALANTLWAEGAWSAVRGYPSRVSFQERRLWFARTNHEPQKEWGSKIFEYENFALDTESDDDALNLPLASNESNEIQWLAPGKSLIAGTYGGAFVTNSGSTAPITPDNANASEEIGYGSEDIQPKKIGNFLYYVQRFGKKLREMFYNLELDTYKASDKTILSPHILDGVVDMDVQQNPESLLYCVLEDGTMAVMTRELDQEVTAWSRHTTSGTYTSIAIIPSQSANYDEAWVIVERWINGTQKKYVEYFENIEVPDRQDLCLYLHSALTYNAYESTSTSAVTISLSASSGSVTLTSSSAYFAGSHVNRTIRAINSAGTTVGEGTITATASTTSITLSITTTFNALSYVSGLWGMSVRSVAGLSHLEAKTVGILADGLVDSLTKTIASATVTMASLSFVVQVGLSYDQILYTLPKEAGTNRGTAQGKIQRYNEIAFKVNRSTQGFKYGQDASNLDDVNLAFTPTVTTLYTGILPSQGGGISMRGGYHRGAQVYIKNSNPLPIEILSIMGALDTEEK